MMHGIKAIVYVASHEMDSLWQDDGVQYHTMVISPAIEPRKTLATQLSMACSFMSTHRPALVCSPCPKLRGAVATAMALHDDLAGGTVPNIRAVMDHLTK